MNDTTITSVRGRRVWDSRGRPTVEAEVILAGGAIGRAIAPTGASKGAAEAIDLRDGGAAFGGIDVRSAVASVNAEIATELRGMDAADQAVIDAALIELDGTPSKSRLGSNATIAVSMAVLHAQAGASGLPLWRHLAGNATVRIPLPEIQVFGGGVHAARRLDIQDFMIVCPAADSFAQALDWTAEVYRAAGELMKAAGRLQGVADEGGYWPAFDSNEEALDTLVRAIQDAGFSPGDQVAISLDIAASQLGRGGLYLLAQDNRRIDTGALIEMLGRWLDAYPIVAIEDPVAEDDPEGFRIMTRLYGDRCHIIGDDFLVTDAQRITASSADKAVTGVLIKPNQAGTITEAYAALQAARSARLATVASARSGDSEDVTIAHLAVGWNTDLIKVGSFTRSERMAKWNECLRIEEAMGQEARFAGWSALARADAAQPLQENIRP